nr:right-handed parallel beta-helix repeat-containing protein [Roseomonas sp. SXEYE001]
MNASSDGDVVQVQAGTYTNDFFTVNTDITIQGVGGMAKIVATEEPSNGKGIIVSRADVTLDSLDLSGAKVSSNNGAGVRYETGNLTITNSYIHDNQNGVLANADASGSITVRNSEFDGNGAGDGFTHNLYANGVGSLVIEDSYFHDAVVGHEIKSRALNTTITNNRIFDNEGNASYSIDLPDGGKAVIADNVIQQSANTSNPAIIHFGGENAPPAGSSLSITGNTVINDLDTPSAKLLLNHTDLTAQVSGNRVEGLSSDQISTGAAQVSGIDYLNDAPALDMSSPWTETSSPAPVEPTPTVPPVQPTPEEPTSDEPTSEEPTPEEPTSDEPTSEEPTPEEPTSEEPTSEEPTSEEPTSDEPTPEEPTSGEPAPLPAGPTAPKPWPISGVTREGTGGNDRLTGTVQHDKLVGLDGNDRLHGGDGHDLIEGGAGDDRIIGGNGLDTLLGGDGNDRLSGGGGQDYLSGGSGDDTLTGGNGNDNFHSFGFGWGNDVVTDFSLASDDVLLLEGYGFSNLEEMQAAAEFDGRSSVITSQHDADTSIKLIGVNVANMTSDDIFFG